MKVSEEQRPKYLYEFTSSQFEKNPEDQLVVKSPELDRDPPNQPMLIVQVSFASIETLGTRIFDNFSNSFVRKFVEIIISWILLVDCGENRGIYQSNYKLSPLINPLISHPGCCQGRSP